MEPTDVIPPADVTEEQREPITPTGLTIGPRWLDIDTAAKYLCMTRHALYHQVARVQLPFIRHGRLLRFDRLALDRWLEKEAIRLREIRGIDSTHDIDSILGTVHEIGKFCKERGVPMQPDASAALKEQLEEECKLWKQNPQRLREVLAEGAVRAKIPVISRTRCATRSARVGSRRVATSANCRRSSSIPASPSPRRTTRTC